MTDNQYSLLIRLVSILERNSYSEVIEFLNRLPNEEDSNFLENCVYGCAGEDALSMVSNHKIALADILTQTSNVLAEAEDRTRIIFLLAKYADSNLKAINQAFNLEFGPVFNIFEVYKVGNKDRLWKELAIRAREVRNGIRNLEMLNARPAVEEIMRFSKIFSVEDEKKLRELITLADIILPKTSSNPAALPIAPEFTAVKQEVARFYKLTGRLDIDIDELNQQPDFDEINKFVFYVKYSALARLYLITKKIPLENIGAIEEILLKLFAERFALSYRGEELSRQHIKLKPLLARN